MAISCIFFYVQIRGPSREDSNLIVDDLLTPCSPGDQDAIELSWLDVSSEKLVEPPVLMVTNYYRCTEKR